MASRLATRRTQIPMHPSRPVSLKKRYQNLEAASKKPSETLPFRSFLEPRFGLTFKKFRALGILMFYIGIRFGLSQQIDSLGAYASYGFEGVFILAIGFLYWHRFQFKTNLKAEVIKGFAPTFILGSLIAFATKPLGLAIPFDVSSLEAIGMLILIGPVLEEFIFRMALWNPLLDLSQNGELEGSVWPAALATSAVFSYAHFHVSWFLPAGEIRDFVMYQTIYVLLLAGFCAYRLIQTKSIVSPILVHIGFNFGFFIGLKYLL